jgi:DNA polymerase III gamma/tau subunit
MSARGWGDKGGRAYVVNEAHGLRKDVIRQLLVLLERIPSHVAIVFTTTVEGQESLFEDYDDASPLLSRCLRLDLARRDLAKAFAERAKQIAEREGLDGQPIER